MDYINKILCGNDLEILPKLPSESVSCITTSPPYFSLRDYGIEPVIWDGDKNCKHIWKTEITKRTNASGGKTDWAKEKLDIKGKENYQEFVDYHKRETESDFCKLCGAWRGNLGLEPTLELYIKHLCDIFDEIKRVLRKDGVCFVNLGDSYGGSGNASGHKEDTKNLGYKTLEMGATQGNQRTTGQYAKSLLDIPYRFSIEMINRGWIKRNTIIWHKPNCMPASADDRFTIDFEYIFFFTKNNKTLFWTNEKTLECVDKNPPGIKGMEGKDWEWRPCPACNSEEKINDKICPRCKGLKKIKYSFWTGHDYWFEQQFEEYAPDTLPRMNRGVNVNKWTLGADGQTPHNLSQPRLNKKREYKIKQPGREIQGPQHHGKDISYGKHGRNKRCVWKISTKSFKEAHFATFPETLIDPIIKAGCPEFICRKCGKARVKIYRRFTSEVNRNKRDGNGDRAIGGVYQKFMKENPSEFIGYSDCGCNAGWESGINIDPFMGAGTTALVALKQRKRFIGIEIKQEYIDMAKKRIKKVQPNLF
jgi:DNA modification methylase